MNGLGRLILVPVSCGLATCLGFASLQNGDVERTDRVTDLLEERRDTLREVLSLVEAKHKDGRLSLDAVLRSKDQFLRSEYQLSQNKEQRLALLTARVDNLRQLELYFQAKLDTGVTNDGGQQRLAAKAARLLAEIELEEAK